MLRTVARTHQNKVSGVTFMPTCLLSACQPEAHQYTVRTVNISSPRPHKHDVICLHLDMSPNRQTELGLSSAQSWLQDTLEGSHLCPQDCPDPPRGTPTATPQQTLYLSMFLLIVLLSSFNKLLLCRFKLPTGTNKGLWNWIETTTSAHAGVCVYVCLCVCEECVGLTLV